MASPNHEPVYIIGPDGTVHKKCFTCGSVVTLSSTRVLPVLTGFFSKLVEDASEPSGWKEIYLPVVKKRECCGGCQDKYDRLPAKMVNGRPVPPSLTHPALEAIQKQKGR